VRRAGFSFAGRFCAAGRLLDGVTHDEFPEVARRAFQETMR
jgi:hypothetical protein